MFIHPYGNRNPEEDEDDMETLLNLRVSAHPVLTQYSPSTHSVLNQYSFRMTQYSVLNQQSLCTHPVLPQCSLNTHSVSTYTVFSQYTQKTHNTELSHSTHTALTQNTTSASLPWVSSNSASQVGCTNQAELKLSANSVLKIIFIVHCCFVSIV